MERTLSHAHCVCSLPKAVPADSKAKMNPYKTIVAGGFAGAVSRTVTAPLDRLKVLLQAQTTSQEYNGIVQGLKKIYSEGGFSAYFRGNGTNIIKIVPESACKFYAYETFKTLLAKDPNHVDGKTRFMAGALAGVTAQVIVYPLEIAKTRLAVGSAGEYSGILDCLKKTAAREGFRGLYKGLVPSLAGVVPYAGVDLATFTWLKELYSSKNNSKEPGILMLLSCGAVSSTCGTLVSYPLALVRTRLQSQGVGGRPILYTGMVDCFSKTFQNEGFKGLFRGLSPNLLKSIPAISISYAVYETTKKYL
jgi:solute carrier family 25 (mitochondrial phosphate transporter), member 23/24/25/41